MKRKEREDMSPSVGQVFLDSFLYNHIVLIQAVGICPIIAVGVNLKFGVVLAVCTAAILLPSSLLMSFFGERLPARPRAPLYTFGSAGILLGAAILLDRVISPELYARLYVFLPLMAVNTLITYRAGGFSVRHRPVLALTDALASSLGFGLVMCLVAALREMVTYGTLWDVPLDFAYLLPEAAYPYAAFIMLAFMAAFLQWLRSVVLRRRKKEAKS